MSLLKALTTDSTIADEKDSVGSGGVLESGLYPSTITLAYVIKSAAGATGLVLHAKTDQDRDIKQTMYMTSGTAKGCKNYYEKDGKKNYLPGFLQAQSLALLAIGKEISELDTEVKVVNVYSYESKKEVPTKVDMIVDLLGKEILIGLHKQTVDKTKKNDAGEYVSTGETREENEIEKFFRASDRMTTSEVRGQIEKAVFIDTWINKHTGKTRDKTKKSDGTAGTPQSVGTAGAVKKPSSSLFT